MYKPFKFGMMMYCNEQKEVNERRLAAQKLRDERLRLLQEQTTTEARMAIV